MSKQAKKLPGYYPSGKKVARLLPFNETTEAISGKLDFRKAAGLGAEIWKDISIETYIRAERDTWD